MQILHTYYKVCSFHLGEKARLLKLTEFLYLSNYYILGYLVRYS